MLGEQQKLQGLPIFKLQNPTFLDGNNVNQVKLQELPLFNLQKLAAATNNFDVSNKLGQGGFGAVYRVMLLP